MITVSIIIPCYNVGRYIGATIGSLRKQAVGNVEFIFVNDGSTDDTLEIVKDFCNGKPYCRIINQTNQGVSAARNAALDICRGDYVYLLDGDDILTDDAVECMMESISTAPDVVLSPAIIMNDKGKSRPGLPVHAGCYTPSELYEACRVFPTMPQLLYKREIIERHRLRFCRELSVGEVYEFTIRFLKYAATVKVVDDCFFFYVMRQSSATHLPDYSKDLTVIDTIRRYYECGNAFVAYPSFHTTAFKMLMSFTYNKYAKLKQRNNEAVNSIRIILSNPEVRENLKKVACSAGVPVQERLLAFFALTTGVYGYRILTRML